MLKKFTFSILCLLIINVLINSAYAQAPADSSNTRLTAYENTVNKFNNALGAKSRLYNGKDYNGDYPGVTGSANFNDATDWSLGTVVYDGYLFKNVKIKYDLL